MERRALQEALRQTGGNKVQAAKTLGISRRGVYHLIHKYGLDAGQGEARGDNGSPNS